MFKEINIKVEVHKYTRNLVVALYVSALSELFHRCVRILQKQQKLYFKQR